MIAPTVRLSRSGLITAGSLLLVGALGIPILDWFDQYEVAMRNAEETVDRLQTLRRDHAALQREQAALEHHWTFRTDSRLQAELDQVLAQRGLRSHVQTFRPAGVTPAGAIEEVLLELTLTDLSQDQFVTFLRAIESLPPPLQIKSVTWRRQPHATHTHEITVMIAAYQRPGNLTTPQPYDSTGSH